jgi:hypothetical protein
MLIIARVAIGAALLCSSSIAFSQDYNSNYSNNTEFGLVDSYSDTSGVQSFSINSFPSFVDHGRHSQLRPNKTNIPKQIKMSYELGKCKYSIEGEKYSISTHTLNSDKEFDVELSSIISQSIVKTNEDNGAVIVSVATDLKVVVEKRYRLACRKILGKNKVYVGNFSFAFSKLTYSNNLKSFKGIMVKNPERTELFLRWDPITKSMALQDESGFKPMVNSAIYAVMPQTPGIYSINFQPKASVVFTQSHLSKNSKGKPAKFAH